MSTTVAMPSSTTTGTAPPAAAPGGYRPMAWLVTAMSQAVPTALRAAWLVVAIVFLLILAHASATFQSWVASERALAQIQLERHQLLCQAWLEQGGDARAARAAAGLRDDAIPGALPAPSGLTAAALARPGGHP